jgi:transposase-like protein
MSRNHQFYSEEFKLSVVRDYYASGMTKYACRRKYHLNSDATLLYWLRKYESEKVSLSLQSESSNDNDMANRSKDEFLEENVQLKKRIRDLEKALEFSRMETLARDMMIDKAEKYFDIPIRKKSGAK